MILENRFKFLITNKLKIKKINIHNKPMLIQLNIKIVHKFQQKSLTRSILIFLNMMMIK